VKLRKLSGTVVTGTAQGVSFTRLGWARNGFLESAGIDPFPGTLNLHLQSAADLTVWGELTAESGWKIASPDPSTCDARCYPVRVGGSIPGAVIVPEVRDYPLHQVEVIAALPLRSHFSLSDGDPLSLEISEPLPVQTVLFDADGTLVDSVDAFRVVAEQAAAGTGYRVTIETVRKALNTPGVVFWELVVPEHVPDRAAVITSLRTTAFGLWDTVLTEHVKVFPGLAVTLENLQNSGYRLAIVTGSDGRSLEPLNESGLLDMFETIVTASDSERRKPHPDILLRALERLGVGPDATVYVGDTASDIQASRAAGMASIGVLTGAGDSASLSAEGPDRIIRTLALLPDVLRYA
jgi:HAD superfamily hydrolase (TIGR01509 family)